MENQFISMVLKLVGWGALLVGFALYIIFREQLEAISNGLVIIFSISVFIFGFGFILSYTYKNYKNYKKEKGEEESFVRITPLIHLQHDLAALATFTIVLVLSSLTEEITSTDFFQAVIAGGGVYFLRWIYKDSFSG